MKETVMRNTASTREAVIASVKHHPSMPTLYGKVLTALNNPDVTFSEIADIIKYDPGITMNVLKAVNSAAFGAGSPIDSLQQAAVRLGSRRLVNIVMAQGVVSQLESPVSGYGLAPQMLLKHSIGVALTAEALAKILCRDKMDLLFTAGLLHDMGKILLGPFVEEHMLEFEAGLADTEEAFDRLEIEILGITHPEAGSMLMEHWCFPELLVEVVRRHHDPPSAEKFREQALMVHLADTLVYGMGVGEGVDGFRYRVHDETAEELGLKTRDLEKIAGDVFEQLRIWEKMM